MRRTMAVISVLATAGCGANTVHSDAAGGNDMSAPTDAPATPDDLTSVGPDVSSGPLDFTAVSADLATAADLAQSTDLPALPDLSKMLDLFAVPDLSKTPDLPSLPDLASSTVMLAVAPLFNVSVIATTAGSVNTLNPIDGSKYVLMTAAFAKAKCAGGVGLPDDGAFASDGNHPAVQLPYRDLVGGLDARQVKTAGSFTVPVPQRSYAQLQIYVTSTEGASAATVTLHYGDGTTDTRKITVSDWFSAPGAGNFRLIGGLDRYSIADFKCDYPKAPSIFGVNLNPSAAKQVTSFDVQVTSGGWFHLFGGAGF